MTKDEQIRQAKRRGDVKALRALRKPENIVDVENVLRDPDHPTAAKIVEGTTETPDNPEMLDGIGDPIELDGSEEPVTG